MADRIVANAPRALEMLQQAYPAQAGKMTFITNGYDEEVGESEVTRDPASICLLHAGEIYAGRDPRPLMTALSECDRPLPVLNGKRWRLVLLGRADGLDMARLSEMASDDVSVCIQGQTAYDEAKRQMRKADILLLMDGPGRQIGVPAKLFEYMGTGRPVLALAEADGDTAWVLRTSGYAHRIAAPNDPTAIRTALLELASELTAGAAHRSSSPSEFTRVAVAKKLASLFNELNRARNR